MNKVQQFFNDIPDQMLRAAIREIKESEESGYIGEIVRDFAKETSKITGNSVSTDLYLTQINLLKQAAYRWIK